MPQKQTNDDREARAYNWALLATLVLLVSLLVQTPARVAAHFVPASVRPMFTAWGGTVWSGQFNLHYRGLQGQVRWKPDWLALFRLKLGVAWELESGGSELSGRLAAGPGGWQLTGVKGVVDRSDLNGLMQNWQLPPSPLAIRVLDIKHAGASWEGSQGQIDNAGGPLEYVLNGQKQRVNLPPVTLTVKGLKDQLELELQQQGGGSLGTFVLRGDMLEARLRQRLLQMAPDYHGVGEPDAVVVTSAQPLNSL